MIDSPYFYLFQNDSIDKQLKIEFDGGVITNEDFHEQQFELTESLCSESELRFGSCEASSIKFKISNVILPLKDKWLTVSETLGKRNDAPFLLGSFKVYSDKLTSDRSYRDVVAYDIMYDILKSDVSAWYNSVLPDKDSTITVKEFRDNFFAYFGVVQENVQLVNDKMIITKTVEPTGISGKTVITSICEINGCFGHIGRDGRFHYIFLKEIKEGLYPSNTLYPRNNLYPRDAENVEPIKKSHYTNARYEDFTVARIDKIQIRQEENDIGCIYGKGENCYIIQDNFLVYGKSDEELQTIAKNLYSVISKVWYRPAHVEAKGNPCLEVGDGIQFATREKIVYTYILQRTLKGIQSLKDTYEAEGEENRTENVNSVRDSIIQLKGKTNTLVRTVEETRIEIKDIEKGLSSKITQTAESIAAEVTRATSAEGELSGRIELNADKINLKVSKGEIISEINQTAETITISASKIDLVGLVNADEFVAKYATIDTLNATKADIEELYAKKAEVNELIANYATIESLNAVQATVGQLDANKANVTDLNAAVGRIDTIEANYITAEAISATNIEAIIERIDTVFAQNQVVYGRLAVNGNFIYKGFGVSIRAIGGVNYLVASGDES